MTFEIEYVGTCKAPVGRSFAGNFDPQFPVGTVFPLEVGKRVVLGKAKDCAIRVDSMIAQRHHIALTLGSDAMLLVENLGGGSNVFASGVYVEDRVTLSPGGRFELGGMLMFVFRPSPQS
ncbi:MAG: FHA domain-containing protein [Polyangiales bacterium]